MRVSCTGYFNCSWVGFLPEQNCTAHRNTKRSDIDVQSPVKHRHIKQDKQAIFTSLCGWQLSCVENCILTDLLNLLSLPAKTLVRECCQEPAQSPVTPYQIPGSAGRQQLCWSPTSFISTDVFQHVPGPEKPPRFPTKSANHLALLLESFCKESNKKPLQESLMSGTVGTTRTRF